MRTRTINKAGCYFQHTHHRDHLVVSRRFHLEQWLLGSQTRSLFTGEVESGASTSQNQTQGRKIESNNAMLFRTHPALKRARIKKELKPLLSLAVHQILQQKQGHEMKSDFLGSPAKQDFRKSAELLARWNGYEHVHPEHLLVTPGDKGRIPLGRGLIAEASPFASENYIILARKRRQSDQGHPDFIVEDHSWYRALERRINDALDRWEERARDRKQRRRQTVKEKMQRSFDAIQAPAADLFVAVTTRLSPLVDFIRRTIRRNIALANPLPAEGSIGAYAENRSQEENSEEIQEMDVEDTSQAQSTRTSRIPTSALVSDYHVPEFKEDGYEAWAERKGGYWNKTDPEDLIILARDESGSTVLLLEDVYPTNRLLALPDSTSLFDSTAKKVKPAYRLRLAGGGLVITCSLVVLGTIPPAYRSLRFILEYPRTAEIVMITLVGSVAYSLWSWASSSKIEQERLIVAAIKSRLTARNEAAIAYLTDGAVDNLTHIIMEEYVSRLVAPGGQDVSTDDVDALVMEIALSVGLFETRQLMDGEEEAIAVKWERAQSALVNILAGSASITYSK